MTKKSRGGPGKNVIQFVKLLKKDFKILVQNDCSWCIYSVDI